MISGIGRRRFLVLGGMLLASGGAMAMTPNKSRFHEQGLPDLEEIFPRQFADWRVDPTTIPILPSPDAQGLLNELYHQVLSRTYIDETGQRVMVVVAYGGDQSDGLQIHRPEICYSAQGFRIESARKATLALGRFGELPVKQLYTVKNLRHEPVTYWMRVGDQVVLGTLERKLAQLAFGFNRTIPDGVLIRISSFGDNPEAAFELHHRFIEAMLQDIDASHYAMVLGANGGVRS